jgi:predicted transcriptional regulator
MLTKSLQNNATQSVTEKRCKDMTNKLLLEMYIRRAGFTNRDLAKAAGISQTSFYDKMNGRTEFRQSEIKFITNHIGLTNEERDKVFFG